MLANVIACEAKLAVRICFELLLNRLFFKKAFYNVSDGKSTVI